MKQHSYIRAYYKCEDCEFEGENYETMEVHFGKTHSDNLECGLCEVQMDTLENLEMHLFTCEIYVCCSCFLKGKSLSELKSHVVNEHGVDEAFLHLKMNRIIVTKLRATATGLNI